MTCHGIEGEWIGWEREKKREREREKQREREAERERERERVRESAIRQHVAVCKTLVPFRVRGSIMLRPGGFPNKVIINEKGREGGGVVVDVVVVVLLWY